MDELEEDFNYEYINVYYWQLEIDQDFNDLQTIYDDSYLTIKPHKPIELFEEGYNVPLSNIGKLVFSIVNVNNSNYSLYDSLGNDVTDNFESFYHLPTRSIVFCSIPSYNYSTPNLFFKFKKL